MMVRLRLIKSLTLIMGASLTTAAAAQVPPSKTSLSGAYTDAQAARGETLYGVSCAMCHGPDLHGTVEAPTLRGRFISNWSGATLDQLMDYINTAMPLHAPGSISRVRDADLIAYLLKRNGVPSGKVELGSSADGLKGVRIDARDFRAAR